MTRVLVIGYGNPLRSESDALGWRVVAQLEAALQNLPEVEVHACQQLTPELAVALSESTACPVH